MFWGWILPNSGLVQVCSGLYMCVYIYVICILDVCATVDGSKKSCTCLKRWFIQTIYRGFIEPRWCRISSINCILHCFASGDCPIAAFWWGLKNCWETWRPKREKYGKCKGNISFSVLDGENAPRFAKQSGMGSKVFFSVTSTLRIVEKWMEQW